MEKFGRSNLTHNNTELTDTFRKAAKLALYSWQGNEEGLTDLVQDLWLWYLERPGTQRKMEGLTKHEAAKTAMLHAYQILSENQMSSNQFRGKNLYSSDSVKDALLGLSTNRYLLEILPRAMESLDSRNADHAEAIRSRYTDGVVPPQGSHYVLVRAVKSLTEHVNVIAITDGLTPAPDGTLVPSSTSPGIGRRNETFPEHRKRRGGPPSDPTGNTAIMLIENPSLRDEYLREEPLAAFLGGRGYEHH